MNGTHNSVVLATLVHTRLMIHTSRETVNGEFRGIGISKESGTAGSHGTYRKDLDRRLSKAGLLDGSIPTASKIPVRVL